MDSRSVSNFELKAINAWDKGNIWRVIKGLFLEYCSNSSVHGVQYFGCKRRTLFEKIWWGVMLLLSLYGCGRLIQNIYRKWDQTPVIVSFAEKSTPVWQIPFPAVTICPEMKVRSQYLNFTELYRQITRNTTVDPHQDWSNETFDLFRAVAQVCDAHILKDIQLNQTEDPNIVEKLRNVSMPIEKALYFCKWRNEGGLCTNYFTETITEEGICFTFNAQSSQEMLREDQLHNDYEYITENKTSPLWSLENGYSEKSDMDTYPLRVLGDGARAGLFVLLNLFKFDRELICRGPVQGFKILLHSSSEYPQVSRQYYRVPLHQEVIISVKPQMITTSEGLREYTPERRQCFFNEERHLRYFKVYTQQNCELECLSNYTLQKCGCAKFSMPRDDNTKVCGASQIQCYNEAEDDMLLEDVKYLVDKSFDFRAKCNCLPACTSVQYDAEISQAALDWKSLIEAYGDSLDEDEGAEFSRLSIYFKEAQFITSKRSELYGLTDFLANCGGLLGLFMGVSLLSLAEMFYFCTIRPFTILRAYQERKRRESNVFFNPPPPITEKTK
ncbi:pickpocket protein 28-like [Anopheles ziemanni]|uniref:pickpocket protein 28-like n=1 Tax=Anopheles coustani TaxID=139045 RepID=UPI002659E4F2|nr:pickpocket protein 28-like [Anopheles coustani]XP_058173991.1 pickpocket protein 28-like [Anopheles ziemanni]